MKKSRNKKSTAPETVKKLFANLTAILSVFVLTLSIIDFFNQAINMLDNTGARVIVIIYCAVALITSIMYISDMFSLMFRKQKAERTLSKSRNPQGGGGKE